MVSNIGEDWGVSVGRGLSLAISVTDGKAACVCATMVNAIASAVRWLCMGFTVGAAWEVQELWINTRATHNVSVLRFFQPGTFQGVGEDCRVYSTTTLSLNRVMDMLSSLKRRKSPTILFPPTQAT